MYVCAYKYYCNMTYNFYCYLNIGHIKTDHLQSPSASTDDEVRRKRIQRFHPEAEASTSSTDHADDNRERPA